MKYSELRNSVQIYNKYVAQRFADMADGTAAIEKWWDQTLQEEVWQQLRVNTYKNGCACYKSQLK